MREIEANKIRESVRDAVIRANIVLPEDILSALQAAKEKESSPRARRLLDILLENAALANNERMALCQDTGLVAVTVELGQEVAVQGGDLEEAINQGIREGYQQGYFRKSVVQDPFSRTNTGDNTPAVIHTEVKSGNHFRVGILPKGAGSENMGQVMMLKPAQGLDGVKEFILKVVKEAGANACPPVIVGAGIGGNMEKAAHLAKKALMRSVNERNSRPDLADLEREMLAAVNSLGIGPQGMGGDTTALAVNIEAYPTHIACLPVAVALGCHCTRRVMVEL